MKWLSFLLLFISPAGAQTYFSAPPVQLSTVTVPHASDLMTNWNREISDGNTAYNNFQAAINAISGGSTAIPSGAVVAFNLASCPSGWTSFAALNNGSFPRVTNGTSPATGTTQSWAMINHVHEVLETGTASFTGFNNSNFFTSGTVQAVQPLGNFQGVGGMATGNSATETRPKNVALTYCQKS
jgi:hypothetical protein